MSLHPSPAVLPLALAAGGLVLTVAACGGTAGQTPTPTSSTTSSTSVAAPEPVAGSTTTTPSPTTPSTAASSTATPTAGAGSDCTVGGLKITYANATGGGGAGSVAGSLTFTNTGSAACTLAGFPGVSFVAGVDRAQVGQAATKTDGAVRTRTLAPGRSVHAALRRTQPGMYGDDCHQAQVDGFRVFPPGSTGSRFVAFRTTGCTSTDVPLLQVGPVG